MNGQLPGFRKNDPCVEARKRVYVSVQIKRAIDDRSWRMLMNLKRFRLADLIRVLPVGSLAAVIVLGAALLGCGSSSLTSGTSNIRVLNAYIPAAGTDGAMTVSVNGTALAGVTNVP